MAGLRRGSKDLIREINESLVLSEIRENRLSSRTEIAGRTGLSLPTVSAISAGLLELGLVEEREVGESTGGRKPVLLALRAEAGFAVGVKVTENRLVSVITDLDGTVVGRHVGEPRDQTVDTVVDGVANAVESLRPAAAGRPIHGVGLGIAGMVDRHTGTVRHGTYANWVDVPLGALLSERLGCAVIVDNDVNALAASEQWYGAGRGVADLAVVSVGRGVGLGLVLDGRLYRGASGGAGEFGHLKVADGPACACGGHGCLEAVASDTAICAEVSTIIARQVDILEAAALARAGDGRVREVFARAGRVIGTATGNLVNVLNPKVIVLAGEGTEAADLLMPGFRAGLTDAVFPGLGDDLEIVVDDWDDDAWARGAASLLLYDLFQPRLRNGEGEPSPFLAAAHAG